MSALEVRRAEVIDGDGEVNLEGLETANLRSRSSSIGMVERWPDPGIQRVNGSPQNHRLSNMGELGREEAKGEMTMFDVFFRKSKKDSNLRIIADAVKEGVRDVVTAGSNVASGVAAVTGISSTSSRSNVYSNTSRGSGKLQAHDSKKSVGANSVTSSGDENDVETKVEYVSVHMKNVRKNVDGISDGPSIFVKNTRLSQTLAHHVGGVYSMEFSPDGVFLATAGEDTSLVIWAVGQKQYQPEDDYEHTRSRPASGNYSDSEYRVQSRPESGAYTISSLGYGYTNTSDNSRPSSGNYSDLKDNAISDGINSASNSTSPQSVGEFEGTTPPKSQGGGFNRDSDEDFDDRGSDFNQESLGSDLSRDISGKYSDSARDRSDSALSREIWQSIPQGTRRDKVIDRDVIIYPIPARVYSKGHSEPIVDMCWSKSNFILTASLDRSVCLWHVSQSEFLQRFEHGGIVTSVDFHPVHDRYFISGCFDGKIRFWDVISNSTVDFIVARSGGEDDGGVTCVKFSPDGGKIVAGFFGGKVVVYYCLTRGDMKYELKYQTEFFCKDRAGAYMAGRKITGFTFLEGTKASFESGIPLAPSRSDVMTGSSMENYLLLVTTNDSNVRLVDWAEKSTFVKYKGGVNETLQTRATTSECNRFITSGTDDGYVIIWEMQHSDSPICLPLFQSFQSERPHKRNATHAKFLSALKDKKTGLAPPVTAARFAPINAIHNLLESAEDLYSFAVQSTRNSIRSRFNSFGSDENENEKSLSSYQGDSTSSGVTARRSGSGGETYKQELLYKPEDGGEFSSLVIATADLDGIIRIYVREKR